MRRQRLPQHVRGAYVLHRFDHVDHLDALAEQEREAGGLVEAVIQLVEDRMHLRPRLLGALMHKSVQHARREPVRPVGVAKQVAAAFERDEHPEQRRLRKPAEDRQFGQAERRVRRGEALEDGERPVNRL